MVTFLAGPDVSIIPPLGYSCPRFYRTLRNVLHLFYGIIFASPAPAQTPTNANDQVLEQFVSSLSVLPSSSSGDRICTCSSERSPVRALLTYSASSRISWDQKQEGNRSNSPYQENSFFFVGVIC